MKWGGNIAVAQMQCLIGQIGTSIDCYWLVRLERPLTVLQRLIGQIGELVVAQMQHLIGQIGVAVAQMQRLIGQIGTRTDTPELRDKLWVATYSIVFNLKLDCLL